MRLKGGNSPAEVFYLRCVAWLRQETLTSSNDVPLGRWRVSVVKYSGAWLEFVFRNGRDDFWLRPECIATNGIDGAVYEPRWHPTPPADDMMEILMLMPPNRL